MAVKRTSSDRLKGAFGRMDTHNEGTVSRGELVRALEADGACSEPGGVPLFNRIAAHLSGCNPAVCIQCTVSLQAAWVSSLPLLRRRGSSALPLQSLPPRCTSCNTSQPDGETMPNR